MSQFSSGNKVVNGARVRLSVGARFFRRNDGDCEDSIFVAMVNRKQDGKLALPV